MVLCESWWLDILSKLLYQLISSLHHYLGQGHHLLPSFLQLLEKQLFLLSKLLHVLLNFFANILLSWGAVGLIHCVKVIVNLHLEFLGAFYWLNVLWRIWEHVRGEVHSYLVQIIYFWLIRSACYFITCFIGWGSPIEDGLSRSKLLPYGLFHLPLDLVLHLALSDSICPFNFFPDSTCFKLQIAALEPSAKGNFIVLLWCCLVVYNRWDTQMDPSFDLVRVWLGQIHQNVFMQNELVGDPLCAL